MRPHHERRREAGAALLVTVLLLSLLGLIGLSSLDTVQRDRQIAGYQNLAQTALYAADAGVAQSLEILRTEIVGESLVQGDCLANNVPSTTLSNGSAYAPDPDVPAGICMLAVGVPCEEIDGSIEQGQAIYLYTIWDVRVQGTAAGGASSRIQAGAERCHAFNN